MNTAEARARLAVAWDHSTRGEDTPAIERLTGPYVPEGYAAWRVGGAGAPITLLPALSDEAPVPIWERYLARVIANGTGECPLCGGAAGAVPARPAARLLLRVAHVEGCGAVFMEADRHYFNQSAVRPQTEGEQR